MGESSRRDKQVVRSDDRTCTLHVRPKEGMSTGNLQGEGQNRDGSEHSLDESFAMTPSQSAVGTVNAMQKLRRGDRGKSEVLSTKTAQ